MEQEKIYTRRQLADIFKVKLDTVKKWETKGLITPAFHLNNRPRYTDETIEGLKRNTASSLIPINVNL